MEKEKYKYILFYVLLLFIFCILGLLFNPTVDQSIEICNNTCISNNLLYNNYEPINNYCECKDNNINYNNLIWQI